MNDDDDWVGEILSGLAWAIAGLIGGLAFVLEITFTIGVSIIVAGLWLIGLGGDDD